MLYSDQPISNQSGVYLLTFTVTDYIDVFTQKKYRDILIEAFQYCI
jgi:hypothetical protein